VYELSGSNLVIHHPCNSRISTEDLKSHRTSCPKRVNKIALVIGNGKYDDYPLVSPQHDAKAIAQALKSIGFRLVGGGPMFDLDKAEMEVNFFFLFFFFFLLWNTSVLTNSGSTL